MVHTRASRVSTALGRGTPGKFQVGTDTLLGPEGTVVPSPGQPGGLLPLNRRMYPVGSECGGKPDRMLRTAQWTRASLVSVASY